MKFDEGVTKAGEINFGKKIGKTTRIYILSSWEKDRIQTFLKQFPNDFAANSKNVAEVQRELEAFSDAPEWMTAIFIFVNELYTVTIGNGEFCVYRNGRSFNAQAGEELHAGDAILLQAPAINGKDIFSPLEVEIDLCKAESTEEWLELLSLRYFWKDPEFHKHGTKLAAVRMFY